MKKHFDTTKELNSKTAGLSGILKRDYTPAHLTKAVDDIDTYATKLDKFVAKQEAQTKKLITKITEYNNNIKTIFDEYDVRKSYHDNLKQHMKERTQRIKQGKATTVLEQQTLSAKEQLAYIKHKQSGEEYKFNYNVDILDLDI